MSKRVLDVGQCDLDHSTISDFLSTNFAAEVVRAHLFEDAISELKSGSYDLVLVNRLLDRDLSDGAEVIKAMQADDSLNSVPVMLISNFPASQQAAVELGAQQGFGKAALFGGQSKSADVVAQLSPFLK